MRNTILYILLLFLFITCDVKNSDKNRIASAEGQTTKILFIVSNQHTYGNTDMNTSNHFAEIVLAYDVLIQEGYIVDFVSPEGGAIPIGYLNTSDSIQKKYIYDPAFMAQLKNTFKPADIKPSNYKAVYYGGGGAAMFGVPENTAIQKITTSIYDNNGIVSAICHGTAGLVNLKNKNGNYLYEGKLVNGFPDLFENKEARYYQTFPFSIEETIKERGGQFMYSEKGWDGFHQVDGRLITGQDPTASATVAKEIIKKINETFKNQ